MEELGFCIQALNYKTQEIDQYGTKILLEREEFVFINFKTHYLVLVWWVKNVFLYIGPPEYEAEYETDGFWSLVWFVCVCVHKSSIYLSMMWANCLLN